MFRELIEAVSLVPFCPVQSDIYNCNKRVIYVYCVYGRSHIAFLVNVYEIILNAYEIKFNAYEIILNVYEIIDHAY